MRQQREKETKNYIDLKKDKENAKELVKKKNNSRGNIYAKKRSSSKSILEYLEEEEEFDEEKEENNNEKKLNPESNPDNLNKTSSSQSPSFKKQNGKKKKNKKKTGIKTEKNLNPESNPDDLNKNPLPSSKRHSGKKKKKSKRNSALMGKNKKESNDKIENEDSNEHKKENKILDKNKNKEEKEIMKKEEEGKPENDNNNDNDDKKVEEKKEEEELVEKPYNNDNNNNNNVEETNKESSDESNDHSSSSEGIYLIDSLSESKDNSSLVTYAYGSGKISKASLNVPQHKLVLVMVGLPARGKSFISRKLSRYLNWMGYNSKIFNLGNYRRKLLGSFHSHDFFRKDNPEASKSRDKMCKIAIKDMITWFEENEENSVAILDGTNSTIHRRRLIVKTINESRGAIVLKPIFIEIICNNPEIIHENILATKLSSPDYKNVDPEKVIEDFKARIGHYVEGYETVGKDGESYRYIKIFDVGKQIVLHRITGFVPSKVMFYLSNLHIIPRPIYLVRHGQSEYNISDRLGGDSPLTSTGRQFAKKLTNFISTNEFFNAEKELCLWSSTMLRTVETCVDIPCAQYVRWKAMEEINVGVCDGLSYEEVEKLMPEEFEARKQDKLRYRYPRGESYEDLIRRLEPVIIELERQRKPILIVAHRAVIRCLYAYLTENNNRQELPYISIPLHCVIKLEPGPYGVKIQRFQLMPGDE
eukprot:TRINITY_DN69_c1_g1_i1.p1 TRINITY_DN69_c1_g1~~TRINITY_DN69_c1_g1_i1.p1  ORF type:complete len:702 (+),score=279.30 TRINITY_DN69_c1_g1_i1:1-2106(+)